MTNIIDLVETATSEHAVGEDWGTFLDICQLTDDAGTQGARECVLAISKRLPHRNPNVALLALALTEGLVNNCGKPVQREISSRQFTQVMLKVLNNPSTHNTVKDKILALIHHCVQVYSHDPLLGYMTDIKKRLITQGFTFPDNDPSKVIMSQKQSIPDNNDELAKRKEQEDIDLAIALSLSVTENVSNNSVKQRTSSSNLGPTSPRPRSPPPSVQQRDNKIIFHVKGMYDFAGTDQGDLPFRAGDVIGITDADYDDWWEGTLRGKVGLIPSNYVMRLDSISPHNTTNTVTSSSSSTTTTTTTTSSSSPPFSTVDNVLTEHTQVDTFLNIISQLNPHTTSPLDDVMIQTQYRKLVDLRPALVTQLTTIRTRRDRLLDLNDKLTRSRATYERLLDTAVRSTGLYQGQIPPPPGYYGPTTTATPSTTDYYTGNVPNHMSIPAPPGYGPPGPSDPNYPVSGLQHPNLHSGYPVASNLDSSNVQSSTWGGPVHSNTVVQPGHP